MAKFLYFVTEDWYFLSHRLPMAKKAKELGFDVVVATKINKQEDKEKIEKQGFKVAPISLNRSGKKPIEEIKSLIEIIKIYKKEKPDIVHHVAIKPTLYGSFASFITKTPAVINALAGMGSIFINKDIKSKTIKFFITTAFRFLLNRDNAKLIVQNKDDYDFFYSNKIVNGDKIEIIKGSGVDIKHFYPKEEPKNDEIIVTMVSRMLWDKGVRELIEASKILKEKGEKIKIRLVGKPDPLNPRSIDAKELFNLDNNGIIEYLGERKDILEIWHDSHIAVLPSYREGLPKSLLEAGACEKPLITTNAIGCSELVEDKINGLLVPVRDAEKLALAIKKLANNAILRKKLGKKAREIIKKEYSNEVIATKTGEIYSLLYEKTKGNI